MVLVDVIKGLAEIDIFTQKTKREEFVGRPFYIDYDKANILVADAWKAKVGGIPQGAFLLAFYEAEEGVEEALLLRALKPCKLPTDNDVTSSMIEYYKDNLKTSGKDNKLDDYTRYEYSFSGLECRVLGTFYIDKDGKTVYGADVENFFSAHNYSVFKPSDKILEYIANLRDSSMIVGGETDINIGQVRYSSSRRVQETVSSSLVYINPKDFLGKRTALFGMTRTGKSNTVKIIIQSTTEICKKAKYIIDDPKTGPENILDPFDKAGIPNYPSGQIIFDINGEYANANLQDAGTAIFEMFKEDVIRYSVLEKKDFKVMKVNFYNDIQSGYELIRSHLQKEKGAGDYVKSFMVIDLEEPEDKTDFGAMTRYERKKAAYLCCLYNAGLTPPSKQFKVKFKSNKDINEIVQAEGKIDPTKGITLEEAANWFARVWDNYDNVYFKEYPNSHDGSEWADEDLKAILVFLTRKKQPRGAANVSGFHKLRKMIELHTSADDKPFGKEIIDNLKNGKIIIVDLSQGDPEIQRLYSERICQKIFHDCMDRFIHNKPNNFIQFYFEEAHILFPKKEDKDLSKIYNRLAKEGAKLNIGVIYATQEVSSISSNILKNTQNWFIAHLNNDDELAEIRKYYDFRDFTEGLTRFSSASDKGFVRMKTYSNPFVVPVQINQFKAK